MNNKGNTATVQGTNDSSILSKHAMVEAGYSSDPFLQVFTKKKAPRRAPLINRGYYIRTKAIESIIRDFLLIHGQKQIISLGAGFDTTAFRLSAALDIRLAMDDVYYVEVDFPEVAQRKKDLMADGDLEKYVNGSSKATSDAIKISTTNYCLIGADIGEIGCLENVWTNHTELKRDLPTLLLSECVMTYMEHALSTGLIKFCNSFFTNSLFVTYEQVEPQDAFGQFMRKHFDKLNSSLKGIGIYDNKERQVARYLACGYQTVDAFSMKEFYDSLPRTEKDRVNQLEYFDEYEEWNLKCFHYVLILARSNSSLFPQIERRVNSVEQHIHVATPEKPLTVYQQTKGSQQFSHASCLVSLTDRRVLLTHGGFGLEKSRHCRQTVTRYFLLDDNGLLSNECTIGTIVDKLPPRLHHTFTALSDSRVFVFGGRLSPSKPISQPVVLQVSYGEGGVNVDMKEIENVAGEPCPRWRHAATHICVEGKEYVLITGGVTTLDHSYFPTVLSSCHLFNPSSHSWSCLPDLPHPVHSHTTCFDDSRYVYLVGGLDGNQMVHSHIFMLDFSRQEEGWKKIVLPVEPVCSHSLHMIPNTLIVVGGIGCSGQQMDLQIVKLSSPSADTVSLPVTVNGKLRMYFNHTSHLVADQCGGYLLYIVGGGGNCFSFGTHINDSVVCHNIVP
ncbi:tRNA wybutosine-synthesizing protein 4-like [Watersipora subatra]|uniref:tRNA wybutosine-synthesizing protein 4-like n=1 Tax=Watersipora subatra TaxID=2589382 RepID=UPI00355BC5C8